MNAAASKGWRIWQYAPEQVIKAGRKSSLDAIIYEVRPKAHSPELRNPAG